MSVPETIQQEKKCCKPFLKLKIGDEVFLKSDIERKYLMMITDYQLDDDGCNDYYCTWLNSQGKRESASFPEECLFLKT